MNQDAIALKKKKKMHGGGGGIVLKSLRNRKVKFISWLVQDDSQSAVKCLGQISY